MDSKKEYILCAAIHKKSTEETPYQPINIEGGVVYCGYRHPGILQQKIPGVKSGKQGFLTSYNRFVDRKEAANIAYEAEQISKKKKVLYSEDLYSQALAKKPEREFYHMLIDKKKKDFPDHKVPISREIALILWEKYEKLHGLQIETIDQREDRGGFMFYSELKELEDE